MGQKTFHPHSTPDSRDARSSIRKQRISTVVAVPCAGLASSEHTNITLTYTHCRVRSLVAARNRRGTVSVFASDDQTMNIHCSGRALCRPRKQRTYKYHANAYPLQGAASCGCPQAVMIHNLLVGRRNLRSSLEEVDSLLTPDKTSGTSAVWGYEIAQSISLEEVD